MTLYKRSLLALIVSAACSTSFAQNDNPIPSINSPYSMYGFGSLAEQSTARSRGMGGTGIALQDNTGVNLANPASYGAADSLTFLFDVGLSLQTTKLSDGNTSVAAKNGALDYVAFQVRLCKRLGLAAAYLPFSKVGYNFTTSKTVQNDGSAGGIDFGTGSYSYTGNGGTQQVMLGLGANPFAGLSLGVNASYLYGDINRSYTVSFSNQGAYSYVGTENINVRDYKIDFGLQYQLDFKKENALTLGATYSLRHGMNVKYNQSSYKMTSGSIMSSETNELPASITFPHIFGAGIAYQHGEKLTVTADYRYEGWGKDAFLGANQLNSRSEYHFGAEYWHGARSRNYFGRVRYRLGGHVATPYAKINGIDAGTEYGFSFGFSLPVFSSRSLIHVTGQYAHLTKGDFNIGLSENTFRLCVGLTFNERWFMKSKVR